MRSACRVILKKGKESQKERQTETNKATLQQRRQTKLH